MKKTVSIILAVLMVALTLCSCGSDNTKNLEEVRIGVTVGDVPYMEVFYSLELRLPDHGYKLIYKTFDTAAQANNALVNGEVDFTCVTTQREFDLNKNDKLVSLGAVYYYPYALFLNSFDKRDDITDGASIAVPSDTQGLSRSLMLLDYFGFITLRDDAGLSATLEDIEKNDRKFDIKPVGADEVIGAKADIMITDSVRAVKAGYEIRFDSIYSEQKDSLAAQQYSIIILTTAENASGDKMKTVENFLFTRRMFNAIDGCTDNIVSVAFDPK